VNSLEQKTGRGGKKRGGAEKDTVTEKDGGERAIRASEPINTACNQRGERRLYELRKKETKKEKKQ